MTINPKQAREILGLTQTQMAKICNASLDTVRSWDQGRRDPQGPSARLIDLWLDLHNDGNTKYLKKYS